MNFARKSGAKVVAITDSSCPRWPSPPIICCWPAVILPPSSDSLCAPLSLINALIVTIAMKRKKDAEETFTKLEGLWDEYNVYEKVDEKSEHES